MAWIRVIGESEANEDLRKVYQQVKGNRGKLSNILAVHSLKPSALQAHMDLYMAIMFSPSGLSWEDGEKLAAFIDDYRNTDLSPKMEVVLDYAFKLTTAPYTMAEADVQRLRDCGLADEEVLTINLIASYFNFVNRVALGLGVAFTADEVEGYKY